MMTVNEVSRLAGVSIRTLQYYDKIGLLRPAGYTESGYRLYDDTALEKLQRILLFRELEFPLKEIRDIVSNPNFDRNKALEQQIVLLTLKKERLEKLIRFAREIQTREVEPLDFSAFDTKQIEEYAKRAKEQWGGSPAYREFEEKTKNWTDDRRKAVMKDFTQIFVRFGELKTRDPAEAPVQEQVKRLREYITAHFYTCTDDILRGLGRMYEGGGEFTANIDRYGGEGTADFTARAIKIFCGEGDREQ